MMRIDYEDDAGTSDWDISPILLRENVPADLPDVIPGRIELMDPGSMNAVRILYTHPVAG